MEKDPTYPATATSGMELEKILDEWNPLNALIRSVGFATQTPFSLCIFVPSGVAGASFSAALVATDWAPVLGAVSLCCVALIVFLLVQASSVTLRCERVPTLVNGLVCHSREVRALKMVAVQHIRSSDSGYRLYNEPVSLFFVVKVIYLLAIILAIAAREFFERQGETSLD